MYTRQELEQIRGVISRLRFLTEEEVRETRAAIASEQCTLDLAPFRNLASANPSLFDKLAGDPLIETYSIYGFFPGVYELVYGMETPAAITFNGRARGRVAILRAGSGGRVCLSVSVRRVQGRQCSRLNIRCVVLPGSRFMKRGWRPARAAGRLSSVLSAGHVLSSRAARTGTM